MCKKSGMLYVVTFSYMLVISSNYYAKTCPNAEQAIADVVKKATKNDKTVPAALHRMHFHDCFIRVPLTT